MRVLVVEPEAEAEIADALDVTPARQSEPRSNVYRPHVGPGPAHGAHRSHGAGRTSLRAVASDNSYVTYYQV